jgi:hypothetical protein
MNSTYKQAFGVDLGNEVLESRGVNYSPCTAAKSLKAQLLQTNFFSNNPGKLGGVGPLYRYGYKHEYNRHHAGLAVDIMLRQGTNEITLGHNLAVLFYKFASTIKFRGMIYEDVTVDLIGGKRLVRTWNNGGHDDHIHIDWHNPDNTTWKDGISQIPLRRRDNSVVQMTPVDGSRIAESIMWAPEASTSFDSDSDLQAALQALLTQFDAGTLKDVDMKTSMK